MRARSDERIVSARLLPYTYAADPPRFERRAETFHTDAFRDQLATAKPATVSLDVGHQRNTPVGHAVWLSISLPPCAANCSRRIRWCSARIAAYSAR